MNPHGFALKEHKDEKQRPATCPFCLRSYTQTTVIHETDAGQSVVWWPKLCIPCGRHTLRTTGPLND